MRTATVTSCVLLESVSPTQSSAQPTPRAALSRSASLVPASLAAAPTAVAPVPRPVSSVLAFPAVLPTVIVLQTRPVKTDSASTRSSKNAQQVLSVARPRSASLVLVSPTSSLFVSPLLNAARVKSAPLDSVLAALVMPSVVLAGPVKQGYVPPVSPRHAHQTPTVTPDSYARAVSAVLALSHPSAAATTSVLLEYAGPVPLLPSVLPAMSASTASAATVPIPLSAASVEPVRVDNAEAAIKTRTAASVTFVRLGPVPLAALPTQAVSQARPVYPGSARPAQPTRSAALVKHAWLVFALPVSSTPNANRPRFASRGLANLLVRQTRSVPVAKYVLWDDAPRACSTQTAAPAKCAAPDLAVPARQLASVASAKSATRAFATLPVFPTPGVPMDKHAKLVFVSPVPMPLSAASARSVPLEPVALAAVTGNAPRLVRSAAAVSVPLAVYPA